MLFALLFFLLLLFCFKAVAYGLDRLRSISEVFIRDNTDVSNVLVMLVVANKLKEEEIERFLLGFMKDVNRYTNIIKQPQASEIAQSNKGFFLSFFLSFFLFVAWIFKVFLLPRSLCYHVTGLGASARILQAQP